MECVGNPVVFYIELDAGVYIGHYRSACGSACVARILIGLHRVTGPISMLGTRARYVRGPIVTNV